MKIISFQGKYRFLSNFYPALVKLNGTDYRTVEHAFQAAKSMKVRDRAKIINAQSPGEAKRLGRTFVLRADWEKIKVATMQKLVLEKFTRHPQLKEKLLATGDAELIEGNWWHDTFWGVCNGEGRNELGKILMKVRTQLA